MKTDIYLKFFVNGEEFILEKKSLFKFEFFKKVMENQHFKNEIVDIDFDIDRRLVNIAHCISNDYEYKLNIHDISIINNYYDYLILDNCQFLVKNYQPTYHGINGYYKDIKEIIAANFTAQTKLELIHKFINEHNLYFKFYPNINTVFKYNLNHNIHHTPFNRNFVRYGDKTTCEDEKIFINYVEFLITEYLLKFNICNKFSIIFTVFYIMF